MTGQGRHPENTAGGPDYQDQNKYYFTKIGFTER